MCSVSADVLVSTRHMMFEGSQLSLFSMFLVFWGSPSELTFQEVSLTSSSRDIKVKVPS